jgi:DNA excision repair protein ERCC-3
MASESTEEADPGETEIESDIASLVRERAGGECENCGSDDSLEIYNTGDGDSFSLSAIKLLCRSCYEEKYTDKSLSQEEVIRYLEQHELPFVTASMVAGEFDVSTTTARKRLTELLTAGDIDQYEHKRQKFYFLSDYQAVNDVVDGLRKHIDMSDLEPDSVEAFARHPYKIIPRGETGEYFVVVPDFLNFSIGHLHDKTEGWRTYIIGRHVEWFSDLPEEVREEVSLRKRYEDVRMDGNMIELPSEEERERLWSDFDGQDGGLHQRKEDTKIQVQKGKEFEVLAKIIDGGNLPFTPSPVDSEDIRPAPSGVTLRDYQEEAWDTLEEFGQVGVFWPMGVGKSFFGLYSGSRIKGEKLVVVPSTSLEQQWEEMIKENAPEPDSWDIRTYQYLSHSDGTNLDQYQGEGAPKLIIFDEAHYVPANQFSKLATISTDYRIGLSASPYREDNREEYIFALTGVPVGMDWQDLVRLGAVEYPDVRVFSYRTQRQKREDLYELVDQKPGDGLIFCDSLEQGEVISDELDVPFVNGDTPADNRIDIIKENRVVVVSRVADEGLSIPSLDWTIEHDFLGKSRRQEMQRTGRLMHGDQTGDDGGQRGDAAADASAGLHVIQMTDEEIENSSERLWSLEEQGFNIDYQRRA